MGSGCPQGSRRRELGCEGTAVACETHGPDRLGPGRQRRLWGVAAVGLGSWDTRCGPINGVGERGGRALRKAAAVSEPRGPLCTPAPARAGPADLRSDLAEGPGRWLPPPGALPPLLCPPGEPVGRGPRRPHAWGCCGSVTHSGSTKELRGQRWRPGAGRPSRMPCWGLRLIPDPKGHCGLPGGEPEGAGPGQSPRAQRLLPWDSAR